ncbi:MAG TPA: succinylglutamate desuccinylase/aspartoacylase family protein [Saprospiraceae bacterium]|nr:succinylglutamate desuccinylase/aspartoacylase family protein [Saprospiraceae bacterium]HMP25187.1 succinylglutamate desuccinylase/aspartoacylase family protein [Saprospiraceae bacterium]
MAIAPLTINNVAVKPGKSEIIKIPVGRLPSGNQILIRAHVYHSKKAGPRVLVMGGVHGDEINGVEIVRRAVTEDLFEDLTKGSVIAIPLLNVYGFINFSRDVTDGKDVNRSFPGSSAGSLASRIAGTISRKILPYIDFGVDFHTGGKYLYNYPQIRFSKGDARSMELAKAFGAPYLVAMPMINKSLRKAAWSEGKPILVYEGGETLRYDGLSIQNALTGIRRLLQAQGMLAEQAAPAESLLLNKTTWMRAPLAGMFRWYKCAGHKVLKGEPLGIINDPFGLEALPLYAPRAGHIIGHNNAPVVNQGDPLFHIGYEATSGEA